MALHRHFVDREDFEVAVAGFFLQNGTAHLQFDLSSGTINERLQKTRFRRFFVNLHILLSWLWLPSKIEEIVRDFRPDYIFTVPDNLHLGWAWRASRKYGIPLVVNFQDLFPISRFVMKSERPYSWVSRFLMNKFRIAARQSETVFYTSEGMQQFFPNAKKGHVLYPVGARLGNFQSTSSPSTSVHTIIYAGNCYGAYGRMLLSLARELEGHPKVRLKIFTAGNDWSKPDQDHFIEKGVLQGFKPFEELKLEFPNASAFLTVMSFEDEEREFVKTSFTTKWLDYAPFGKPVIAWAPHYSSAAIFSRENDCGFVIGGSCAANTASTILNFLEDLELCRHYGEVSKRMAETTLNPDRIHATLKNALCRHRCTSE